MWYTRKLNIIWLNTPHGVERFGVYIQFVIKLIYLIGMFRLIARKCLSKSKQKIRILFQLRLVDLSLTVLILNALQ